MNNEYLKRNLVVAKAYGVEAGMNRILSRISSHKKPPLWMLIVLEREILKMKSIIESAVAYRDEVSP